jgi:hypothetical protein
LAPLNSDEWHSTEPAKDESPGRCDGKFFSPECPVAWMMWWGCRVRVSVCPFWEREMVTVQRRAVSSHDDLMMELLVQTLSSRSLA